MIACVDTTPSFKVGDPQPDGYLARQAWAQVHLDAGLKQKRCCQCSRWVFPHQLSGRTYTFKVVVLSLAGQSIKNITSPVCSKCLVKHPNMKLDPVKPKKET